MAELGELILKPVDRVNAYAAISQAGSLSVWFRTTEDRDTRDKY